MLCFLVPPLVLLLVPAALALARSSGAVATVGLLVGLIALLWVAVGLAAFLLRGAFLLFRRRPGDLVLGQLQTLNPTVTLLHAPTDEAATALLDRAAGQRGPLLVLSDGITVACPAPTGADGLRVEPLSDRHGVLIVRRRDDPAPRAPTAPGRFRAGDAVAILGGSAVALAVAARLLADPDPDVRDRTAREWCAWEERHVTATTGPRTDARYVDPAFRMRFARLVTHYWSHAAWLQ